MKTFAYLGLVAGLSAINLVGCTQKSTSTEQMKITTPKGTTTVNTTTEVKKTGDHKTNE